MKTIKVSEATGAVLDWLVAEALNQGDGQRILRNEIDFIPYTTDWAHGGPVIEKQALDIFVAGSGWQAYVLAPGVEELGVEESVIYGTGPTPLIATMRCLITAKLGDEVEVPEELT